MSDSNQETDLPPSEESADAPSDFDPATEDADPAIPSPAAAAAGEFEKLRKEKDDNYNRYLRAVADLDTYRRRVVREKDELRQFANRDLIESLLPVYESLSLAIASAQQAVDADSVAKGLTIVLDQFRSVLATKDLIEINPDVGADFDPHQHESIGHAPHDSVPEEKIVQVVRVGFSLSGRLIRPASVLLSKGPAGQAAFE